FWCTRTSSHIGFDCYTRMLECIDQGNRLEPGDASCRFELCEQLAERHDDNRLLHLFRQEFEPDPERLRPQIVGQHERRVERALAARISSQVTAVRAQRLGTFDDKLLEFLARSGRDRYIRQMREARRR